MLYVLNDAESHIDACTHLHQFEIFRTAATSFTTLPSIRLQVKTVTDGVDSLYSTSKSTTSINHPTLHMVPTPVSQLQSRFASRLLPPPMPRSWGVDSQLLTLKLSEEIGFCNQISNISNIFLEKWVKLWLQNPTVPQQRLTVLKDD